MIVIREDFTLKCPGITSFYISCDYNPNVVQVLKSLDCRVYDKKTTLWEIPLVNLSTVLDGLILFDDIELYLKEDIEHKQLEYNLSPSKTPLFKHQIEAVQYGLNRDSWLLLDLPGCGKSLSMIALANELRERYGIKHCLVICGLNNLKYNWVKEIHTHCDESCVILGQYYNKKNKLKIGSIQKRLEHLQSDIKEFFVITNIETLRNEQITEELLKQRENYPYIIVDEIHKCKNPTSLQGSNLLKTLSAQYKVGATGTLLLNNPLDTYVPLKWIGVEKSTYTTFKSLFCEYIDQYHTMLKGFKNLEYLSYIIQSCSLRRSNYADLPPLTIIPEYVEMEADQQVFYDNVLHGIAESVDKVHLTVLDSLALTTRLRQVTALPSILTSEHIPSAKIDRACELADEITSNGDKVVIFSTFKPTVYALATALADYNPVVSTGDDKDNILDLIDDFQQDPAKKIFITTWQKAGAGFTITKASYLIFIDTPWTYGAFEQAYKRVHRTGSEKPVFVYELITKDTFDENVHEILYDKQALSDYVVDQDMSEDVMNRIKKHLVSII